MLTLEQMFLDFVRSNKYITVDAFILNFSELVSKNSHFSEEELC